MKAVKKLAKRALIVLALLAVLGLSLIVPVNWEPYAQSNYYKKTVAHIDSIGHLLEHQADTVIGAVTNP